MTLVLRTWFLGQQVAGASTTRYYVDQHGRLSRIQSDGSRREVLARMGDADVSDLELAPDESRLLFLSSRSTGRGNPPIVSVVLFDLKSRYPQQLDVGAGHLTLIGFSPDGTRIACLD